jgi:xanthine/uracil/vitamin C permease (AzgA family)
MCALVMVGVYSLEGLLEINFSDICDVLPAFFTIMTMAFTYSIANGICAGFIFFSWMRTVRFLYQKVCTCVAYFKESAYDEEKFDCTMPHPLMIIIACFCAVRFAYLAPGHQ